MRNSTLIHVGSLALLIVGFCFFAAAASVFGSQPLYEVGFRLLAGFACCDLCRRGVLVVVPTEKLKEGLRALRPLKGKTRREVFRELGRPRETEEVDNGETRVTWAAPRLAVTLAFRDGACLGVVKKAELDA